MSRLARVRERGPSPGAPRIQLLRRLDGLELPAQSWRATFYVTGAAHSIVGGSAWEASAVAGGAAGRVGTSFLSGARERVVDGDSPPTTLLAPDDFERLAGRFVQRAVGPFHRHAPVAVDQREIVSGPDDLDGLGTERRSHLHQATEHNADLIVSRRHAAPAA